MREPKEMGTRGYRGDGNLLGSEGQLQMKEKKSN